jgi:four helix bundle protein
MGKPIRSFHDLLAWQKAMELCVHCYRFAAALPASERFELGSQIRRAASSVPLNIAEGFGLGTRPAFAKHLRIARASICEVQAALELCSRLELGQPSPDLNELCQEALRLLQGLINSLRRAPKGPIPS